MGQALYTSPHSVFSSAQTQVLLFQVIYEETESPISKVTLLQMVTAAMKLKDTCSLEEKLWST